MDKERKPASNNIKSKLEIVQMDVVEFTVLQLPLIHLHVYGYENKCKACQ